jgi:hypothetical protein
VMAHSMGNIPLSEALHQHRLASPGTQLVQNAIMSQAAISSHYFVTDPWLIPIFYNDPNSSWVTDRVEFHFIPNWTEYRGFGLQNAIGGLTPRFSQINQATGKLLNYYNPDDYALAGWKMVQAAKPTAKRSNAYLISASQNIDFGNASLGSNWEAIAAGFQNAFSPDYPGFGETKYTYNSLEERFYRWTHNNGSVLVPLTDNPYEAFAFCASSVGVSVGGIINWNRLVNVFNGGLDLSLLAGTTRFNAINTGHSAQFIHSYVDVASYWSQLRGEIE